MYPGASMAPLLPLLFRFKSKPYDVMGDFGLHEPLFKINNKPRKTTVVASRQVGKTLGMAAEAVLLAGLIPHFKLMAAFPLQSQANYFSSEYVKPLIQGSPYFKWLSDESDSGDAVTQRGFMDHGTIFFRYIGSSADRARGSAQDAVYLDEYQDLEQDNVEVVRANMNASQYKFERRSGTPKSFDNPLQASFDSSSQAIWQVVCEEPCCRRTNSAQYEDDLVKMLGEYGLVCAYCGKPVDAMRQGYYRHLFPDRVNDHLGIRMPGPLFPMTSRDPIAWSILKQAQRELKPYLFINEYLGSSFDGGTKMITWPELEQAATVPWVNPEDLTDSGYVATSVGVDWGGKGRQSATDKTTAEHISNTALAACRLRDDRRVEIPWLYTTLYDASYEDEADTTLHVASHLRANYVAHDAGGGGDLRQSILLAKEWPIERIAPFTYGSMGNNRPIIRYMPPKSVGSRVSYTVDKSRAITLVIHLIRTGWVLLPEFSKSRNYLADFLNIYEETREGPTGAPKRYIGRISGRQDDIVHAIVFGVLALYHTTQLWPDTAINNFLVLGSGGDDQAPG